MAVDRVGHLLAAHITAANAQDRGRGSALAATVQEVPGDTVAVALVAQGNTGDHAAHDAAAPHRRLAVVTRPEAQKGFVLLPTRWVVERRNAWAARLRRLARDYAPWAETLAAWHCVAFALLRLQRVMALLRQNA